VSFLCVQSEGDGSLHIGVCCKLLGSQLSHTTSCSVYSTMAGRLYTTPCSPDLMPSDLHLFEPCRKHSVGNPSAVDINMRQAVTWLQALHTDPFYARTGFGAKIGQLLKCDGVYVCVWCVPFCYTFSLCTLKSE
jgi:hypothetical protein